MNSPYFSIVIPTYRRRKLLHRAVQSARSQTFTDFEIIVVNNDGGQSLKQEIDALGDPRIRYFDYAQKQGVSAARNKGVAEARGNYVCFLDDDDEYLPNLLAEVHRNIGANSRPQSDFIWCAMDKLFYRGEKLIRKVAYRIDPRSLQDNTFVLRIGAGSLCVNADAIRAVAGFDEEMTASEDRDLILKLLEQNYRGALLDQVLYKRYYHEGERLSSSLQHSENARHDQILLDKHDPYLRRYPALAQKLRDQLAQNYFLAGDLRRAREIAWTNWKSNPLRLKATRRLLRYCAHPLFDSKSDRRPKNP